MFKELQRAYICMNQIKILHAIPFLVPFHLFFCLFSAFLQLTCAEEINSAAPNLKKKKKKNDARINNLPDMEYARRSAGLMDRLQSGCNDAGCFSIKEKKKKKTWDKMSRPALKLLIFQMKK